MLRKNLYFSNTNKKKIIESLISNSEGPILRDVCMNINEMDEEMDEEMGSKVFKNSFSDQISEIETHNENARYVTFSGF